jgi:hypothetical protein
MKKLGLILLGVYLFPATLPIHIAPLGRNSVTIVVVIQVLTLVRFYKNESP